jgi:hypothetical protein
MKNAHRWLRLILAAILLVNIIIRYHLMLEHFELRWVEGGWFSWLTVPFAIRGVLFIEAIIIIALIFGNTKNSLYWPFLLLIFYVLELWWNANNLYSGAIPFFCYFTNLASSIVLITLVAINISLVLLFQPLNCRLSGYWQILIGVVFCVTLFYLNPLESKYFKLHTEPYDVGVSEWNPFFEKLYSQYPELAEHNKLLLPFFSTHCNVCAWNAEVIETARRYYNNDQVIAVFFESPSDISSFIDNTHLQMPYVVIPIEMAFNLVGDGFPAFVMVEHGEVIKDLAPNQFNYAEIHQFFSQD